MYPAKKKHTQDPDPLLQRPPRRPGHARARARLVALPRGRLESPRHGREKGERLGRPAAGGARAAEDPGAAPGRQGHPGVGGFEGDSRPGEQRPERDEAAAGGAEERREQKGGRGRARLCGERSEVKGKERGFFSLFSFSVSLIGNESL